MYVTIYVTQITGFSHFYQLNSILIFSSFIHLFMKTWVVSTLTL